MKNKSIEQYKKVGAEFRFLKNYLAEFYVDAEKVLSQSELDKIRTICRSVNQICSKTEEQMFRNCSGLDDSYLNVFNGSLEKEPNNEIDAEEIQLARTVVDKIFNK